jgi:hypothetical protein
VNNYPHFGTRAPLTSPQPIRFVGGPYHGRTMTVGGDVVELAVLNNRPVSFYDDGTLKNAQPVSIEKTYYRLTWLGRTTPTLRVEEQVMLWDRIPSGSMDAVERWKELRAA